jgi:hypothetical protein
LKTSAVLLGEPVESMELAAGGRNSRVFRLRLSGGRSYTLKLYFRHVAETRNRMETEFNSLSFLWRNGLRNVPRPVVADEASGCAIYEWIEGSTIDPGEIGREDIEAAVGFLAGLAQLRVCPGSASLGPASEACFSGVAVIENLRARLHPFEGTDRPELQNFFVGEFLPAFDLLCSWSRERLAGSFDRDLSLEARTLSPSDFGFHNALRRPDGEIVFLDMEYFGWDDPAKTVCDFLLHPAMSLAPGLRAAFAPAAVRKLDATSDLSLRVEALYPLFGLKWSLILLNEFLPHHILRRRFAGMSEDECQDRQQEQLSKAKAMLHGILAEYDHLPYLD